MIFGSQRDFNLLIKINRELLSDVIEQEVLYYKMSLEETQANIYGEAQEKVFWSPVKVNCLIDRGEPATPVDEFGPDVVRTTTFKFLREDLKDVNTVPEVGDIIQWQEDYYEVDNTNENQLFLGKDPAYAYSEGLNEFGTSFSIILFTHLTTPERLGITQERL
jgi:hypothetical protein